MEHAIEVEEAALPRGRARTNGTGGTNTIVLGPRDTLTGNLNSEGDVRIQGTVEGEVRASGDIDVEASGTARARLEGRNVTVRGNVTGDIVARRRLNLGGSGTVTGEVRASRLQVDDGATINGSISMGPVDKSHSDGEAPQG